MARSDERFVRAYNELLEICNSTPRDLQLPSEVKLSATLGVSRTTVRRALQALDQSGLIEWNGRVKKLSRPPEESDYREMPPQLNSADQLETLFMNWILRSDVPPGTTLNVAQLSKKFSATPQSLQEFLFALSRFGLVERRNRGGWILNGFTREFAAELSDHRAVLELNAVRHFVNQPSSSTIWTDLEELEIEHRNLLSELDDRFHDFSSLDERFHKTVNSVVRNRFSDDFQRTFSIIFHYHYQWNKSDERVRNEVGVRAHLRYIEALKSRDEERALQAASIHLSTAKQSLLNSMRIV